MLHTCLPPFSPQARIWLEVQVITHDILPVNRVAFMLNKECLSNIGDDSRPARRIAPRHRPSRQSMLRAIVSFGRRCRWAAAVELLPTISCSPGHIENTATCAGTTARHAMTCASLAFISPVGRHAPSETSPSAACSLQFELVPV